MARPSGCGGRSTGERARATRSVLAPLLAQADGEARVSVRGLRRLIDDVLHMRVSCPGGGHADGVVTFEAIIGARQGHSRDMMAKGLREMVQAARTGTGGETVWQFTSAEVKAVRLRNGVSGGNFWALREAADLAADGEIQASLQRGLGSVGR